nr:MAG TPA: holin [Caudoviricetes sp.]
MKNHHYDALKNVALLWIPALATLINTVGMVWGLPYTNEITATITAVGVFLGAGLKISSNNYTPPIDGDLVVTKHDEVYADFPAEPSALNNGDTITMRVTKPSGASD